MVQHTLSALAQVGRLHAVWVVLDPSDDLFAAHVPTFAGRVARVGGPSRAHTVLNGLAALRADGAHADDWVLVHDAARCLLRAAWVDALIEACEHDPVGGLLALPVADTLKRAHQGRVAGSVERADAWQAQTPQMFRVGRLHDALTRALTHGEGQAVTDEASAIESLGDAPLLVQGALENFKLTFPTDFELAERILRTRS
jgi:2-C-methyl-D-erythritol 4-phosphate cytidylyltransferase